jgi:hypothetical protein
MAKSIKAPRRIVERNIELLDKLMRYLIAEPQIFSSLPDNFELVILPEDDPAVRLYNLELLDQIGTDNKPVVFARISSAASSNSKRFKPHLYVPIAA